MRINKDFYYNKKNGEVNSYIISLRSEIVKLKKLDVVSNFKYDELIWTELSKKYILEDMERLAIKSNFKVEKHFLDCKHYFTYTPILKI